MKLVKQNTEEKLLNKRYLIPSILAIGFVPLIMHEHTYRTHLENEDWFAVGNYNATDFFLFWKQWAVIILALVCLLLLLIRAKYYKEKLPWEKKAFIPLGIYCLFVFLSACFAKKPLFAWAGGYDMFQSAPAILSYVVLFYYTYSCIKSMDHVLYLLRGAEIGITIELVISFSQVMGHDLIATTVGKAIVTNSSRWGNLDSLTLSPSIYGTLYNQDYQSMYLPVIIPIFIGLIIVEKEIWRKIFNAILLLISAYILINVSSSAKIALVGALIIGLVIICTRDKKQFVSTVIMLVCIAFSIGSVVFYSCSYYRVKVSNVWNIDRYPDDSDVPIENIKTGTLDDGITVELKDGNIIKFWFSVSDGRIKNIKACDKKGSEIKLVETNKDNQTYTLDDARYQSENMYFYRDDTHWTTCLGFVKDNRTFYFTDTNFGGTEDKSDGYYLLSTAGRTVKLPQKNSGKVYHIFHNGFWSARGPIYNRSIPLLKKYMIVGAGADNFIMAYPQRDYINDYYLNNGSNSLNVKPHSYYLQVWIQEGFVAFIVVMTFFLWYLNRAVKEFRKTTHDDHVGVMGFAIMISIIVYLIAVVANDSTICTAPVFWTFLGIGWGVNSMEMDKNK